MCWAIAYFEEQAGPTPETATAGAYDDIGAESFGLSLEQKNLWGRTVFAVQPSPDECSCGFFLSTVWFDEADKPDQETAATANRLRSALRAFIAHRLIRPGVRPCLVLAWSERLENFSLPAEGRPLALADLETAFDMNGPNGLYHIHA